MALLTSNSGVSVWRTSLTKTLPWPRHWRPERRIILCNLCCSGAACVFTWGRGWCTAPRCGRRGGGLFLRFIQRGDICHALAALFRRKGIDEQCAGLTRPCPWPPPPGWPTIHRSVPCRDGGETGPGFRQHTVGLRTAKLDVFDATGIHHRHVGTQPLTDRFIGGTHFFQHFAPGAHALARGGDRGENVWGNAWQRCARWPRPLQPRERYPPIGGWHWCRERCRQPEGGGRFHRANAEGGVEDALRGLLLAGVKMPQEDDDTHSITIPSV